MLLGCRLGGSQPLQSGHASFRKSRAAPRRSLQPQVSGGPCKGACEPLQPCAAPWHGPWCPAQSRERAASAESRPGSLRGPPPPRKGWPATTRTRTRAQRHPLLSPRRPAGAARRAAGPLVHPGRQPVGQREGGEDGAPPAGEDAAPRRARRRRRPRPRQVSESAGAGPWPRACLLCSTLQSATTAAAAVGLWRGPARARSW